MANTGAPWNLPSPDLPDQPHAPAQMGELADAVAAALGRAIPCVSTALPTAVAGAFAFATDTDTLYFCFDGTNWRVLFSMPTITGGTGLSPGTLERTDVLTAATGFSVANQRFYKTGGAVWFTASITRTGATLTAANGDITNTVMATAAVGWRPPLGNWTIMGGSTAGKVSVGWASDTGAIGVGAIPPATAGDWTSGGVWTWGGSWPCGDG